MPARRASCSSEWLARQLPETASVWLGEQLAKLSGEVKDRELYVALGMAPRKLGKHDLVLSATDLAEADGARPGWDPRAWSLDQAARIVILLQGGGTGEAFARALCASSAAPPTSASRSPSIAACRSIRMRSGSRRRPRKARAATCAPCSRRWPIATPIPKEQFAENRWNHMVLKALFVGSTLHPIQGLDERANPPLARMLSDYAHERWAAGRPVSPELWRCVGPHADAEALADLQRVLATGGAIERQAAALALHACPARQGPRAARCGAGPGRCG